MKKSLPAAGRLFLLFWTQMDSMKANRLKNVKIKNESESGLKRIADEKVKKWLAILRLKFL